MRVVTGRWVGGRGLSGGPGQLTRISHGQSCAIWVPEIGVGPGGICMYKYTHKRHHVTVSPSSPETPARLNYQHKRLIKPQGRQMAHPDQSEVYNFTLIVKALISTICQLVYFQLSKFRLDHQNRGHWLTYHPGSGNKRGTTEMFIFQIETSVVSWSTYDR